MNLLIDNLDGLGAIAYGSAIDAAQPPQVIRKLNQAAELHLSLVATGSRFIVPACGARVSLSKNNGHDLFSGYVIAAPEFEYLGWGEQGPSYRYIILAHSDETLLDEKRLPVRCPFVNRTGGDALQQLTQDLMPGAFDLTAIQDVDTLVHYASGPEKQWSAQAAEIATVVRGCYRAGHGKLIFTPIGLTAYPLDETDANFSPGGLKLRPVNAVLNDLTVIGDIEPQAYVKDYFIGDGVTLRFYLSQSPFRKSSTTLFDEEYATPTLDPTRWTVRDPAGAIVVNAGKLQVSGGAGTDGTTTVEFVENLELGGATVLDHGSVIFGGPSSGILGGIYTGSVSSAECLAGFGVTPSAGQSAIRAIIQGIPNGSSVIANPGHHYVLTTRIFSLEIYQRQQIFHSAVHAAGNGVGGATSNPSVRIVLEVQDIDPSNPASLIAPSTVIYDGTVIASSSFCAYALVNSSNLQCSIAFTKLIQAVDTEVRTALPAQNYRTRLVGTLAEGAECNVTSGSELIFFSAFAPAPNQAITVHYRGRGQALARVTSPVSIAAEQRGIDDGKHGTVKHIRQPQARTSQDCENAGMAMLDDSTIKGWTGEYDTWSDFLPGNAQDIFPGDAFNINMPSRGAIFEAIVLEVLFNVRDFDGEHSAYQIKFASASLAQFAFEFQGAGVASLTVSPTTESQVGQTYLSNITTAEITQVSSTTVSIDAGTSPIPGGGFEVRWTDEGWGNGADSNLAGRFSSQAFTLPRLARTANYFLRQYDASVPPKYSRFSAALHVDYPL